MKKIIISFYLLLVINSTVNAELAPDANLSIEAGSFFGMEGTPGVWFDTSILGFNGINLATVQPASGSHSGPVDGSESPDIDQPWEFYGNTGMHQSTSPITVLTDDGNGNVTLDFSGWDVTWSGIASINMGTGPDAGIASMTCATDCSSGDSYTLSYLATIPQGDPSGLGGINYRINLIGTVTTEVPPLPANTLLTLEAGNVPDATPCTLGSCFNIDVSTVHIWNNLEMGTDGGFVVGKDQLSGGQELGLSPDNMTPGEMTAAWFFFGNYGTFSSVPGGASNVYHSASCAGADCIGKTEIHSLYVAWNGNLISLGGGTVNNWAITLDGLGGGSYDLDYSSVVPAGDPSGFGGVPFRLIARGSVILPPANTTPVVNDLSIENISGQVSNWTPDFTDDAGDTHSCMIVNNATQGNATVNADCSAGTYISGLGYYGPDSFTYSVTDQSGLSAIATVTINILEDPCREPGFCQCQIDNPLMQVTTVGGGQSTSVNATVSTTFTGHIMTTSGLTTGGKNAVKVCPGTSVEYEASATVGAAKCSINSVATSSIGTLGINDKLICSNKPDGRDIDRFVIKSGE